MADVYSLSIRADTTDVARARQALNGLSSGAIRAEKTTKQLSNANQQLARTSRFSANGLRNTSLQLSQVAQQGAATGNFLQALAIQLPDLALAFGPVGIALGAVAGGLASYVLGSQEAAEETKTLIERIDGLDLSYEDLNDEIRETLRLEKARAEARIQEQITEQSSALRIAEQRVKSYNNALNATGQAGARFGGAVDEEKLQEANETVTELGGELGFLELQLQQTQKRFDEYINGTGDADEGIKDANDRVTKLNESLQFQVETYGESARVIALAKIEQLEKNGADATAIAQARELTNALYDQIEADERLKENLKQSLRPEVAEEDPMLQRMEAQRRGMQMIAEESDFWTQKMADNQQQISQSILGTMGSVFSALQTFTEQGTAEWAAMVLAQKGIMAAQAIMAANLAATLALASPFVGTAPLQVAAQAETIRQIGYVNAGLILATGVGEIVAGAREMGGSVTGGRSYLVGESGPEVVTMGGSGVVTPSSVMDAGKNQGGDWVVNINNAPPGTRTESRTDDSGNRYTEVFIADMANGGPMSKTIQGTFGLRRQGR